MPRGRIAHAKSGVRYRIERTRGGAILRFDTWRGSVVSGVSTTSLDQGTVGHSYLYMLEGFLYRSAGVLVCGRAWTCRPVTKPTSICS